MEISDDSRIGFDVKPIPGCVSLFAGSRGRAFGGRSSGWRAMLSLLMGILTFTNPVSSVAGTVFKQKIESLSHASYLVSDIDGKTLFAFREKDSFIPASTTKLLTAWLALKHWGENHRFQTTFRFEKASATLWVKGGGDPFLVSEELAMVARKIRAAGVTNIQAIALDGSLFESNLVVPGASTTENPYDAIPSAIACNFNTVNLKVVDGRVFTAEPQTPLTPFARTLKDGISSESTRINTGRDARSAEQYFGELLAELLRLEGVSVTTQIVRGRMPVEDGSAYTIIHENSRTLGEIIELMLKFSTNFIANQLILKLVAEEYGRPANFTAVRKYMEIESGRYFNWTKLSLYEGAGLSRNNQLSAAQLIDLLKAFMPWRHLLSEVSPGVYAKTGSLENVSTLAGYIEHPIRAPRIFAVLVNESVDRRFTGSLAKEIVGWQ